jgi:hypothetical protein
MGFPEEPARERDWDQSPLLKAKRLSQERIAPRSSQVFILNQYEEPVFWKTEFALFMRIVKKPLPLIH